MSETVHAHFIWLERDGDGPARAYFGEWIDDVGEKTGDVFDRFKEGFPEGDVWNNFAARCYGSTLLMDLLREIILISNFVNLMQLRFDPIDMLFFGNQNMFQQLPARVIAGVKAALDTAL